MAKSGSRSSDAETPHPADADRSGKRGKGAGTKTGGVSGGKAKGGTERPAKTSPDGKGSGNR